MKKEDKRGLSTVIATMIIILLVIVAIAIVWGVIKNMIVKNSELVSLGKFTVDLEIVSVTKGDGEISVTVKRNPGEGELEGIMFTIVDKNGTTQVIERRDVDLDQLETKTFILDYDGEIDSISIYPVFLTESGASSIGEISDIYSAPVYSSGGGGDDGDDGTGDDGDDGGDEPPCLPDCTNEFGYPIQCGTSENNCGECAECDTGYHCDGGACVLDCAPDCEIRECGKDPVCGTLTCGYCEVDFGPNYFCNESYMCEECFPDCGTRQCGVDPICGTISCGPDCAETYGPTYECNISIGMCVECTDDCEISERECGPVPNGCGESCGNCSELYPGYPEDSCTLEGFCYMETVLNIGHVDSYWPWPDGRMLFDSEDLPKSPSEDYYGYWVKFPGSNQPGCLQIYDFVTPINPNIYNKTYMKISQDPTFIEVGNDYEVWETIDGCCMNGYC